MFLSKNIQRTGNQMSIQKRPPSLVKQPKNLQTHTVGNVSASNVIQDRFTLCLRQQDSKSSTSGVTAYFPIIKDPSWKRTFFDLRSISTMIVGSIDGGFPGGIALKAIQMTGTKDQQRLPTRTLGLAKPIDLSGHVVASDITAYSVIYQLKNQQCLWDVSDVAALSLFITAAGSDQKVLPPYANDVVVQFAILGVK